jgi:hypothetical protein
MTDTIIKAFDAGIIDQATAMQELKQASEITGMFSNIKQEDIDEQEQLPPMPEIEPTEQQAGTLDRIKGWISGKI